MPFVPFPFVVQAEMRFTYDGQNAENVLYFKGVDPWSVLSATDLAEALIDAWIATMQGGSANTLTLREIYITDLSSESGFTVSVTPTVPSTGTASTAGLPNNVTYVVSFSTFNRGRSFRGRNYVLGLTEGDVTANTVAQGVRDRVTAFFVTMDVYLAANEAFQVVASRIANGVERAEGVSTLVTGRSFKDNIVDSQRRRLPGRGN